MNLPASFQNFIAIRSGRSARLRTKSATLVPPDATPCTRIRDMPLPEACIGYLQIVVTAQKRSERLIDVPIRHSPRRVPSV
jgi:hypothetical protein